MPDEIVIRQATLADVGLIARHRAAMFLDMGSATQAVVERLTSDTEAYLRQAIPSGEYLGWLASLASRPADPIAVQAFRFVASYPSPGAGLTAGRTWPTVCKASSSTSIQSRPSAVGDWQGASYRRSWRGRRQPGSRAWCCTRPLMDGPSTNNWDSPLRTRCDSWVTSRH